MNICGFGADTWLKLRAFDVLSFPFTFSRIAYLANDDVSRHFMVLEVGPGRDKVRKSQSCCSSTSPVQANCVIHFLIHQFHQLSTALSAELRRAFRAKPYYQEARFHASTACIMVSTPDQNSDAAQILVSRFSGIVDDIEAQHGPQLRKCQQVWASRIGVQVANRVTYVDL